MTQLPPLKQTKAQILEEYNRLLEKYEELKITSQVVYDKNNIALFDKAKEYAGGQLAPSIIELKNVFNSSVDDFIKKLEAQAQKFTELQTAIDLAKRNLEVQYHVQVAAGTLEQLVNEYLAKKKQLEEEIKEKTLELEGNIALKKRDGKREEEEYEYEKRTQRKREEELYQFERSKKEQDLIGREQKIQEQENEVQKLREEVQGMDRLIAGIVSEKEKEITSRIKETFEREWKLKEKDWEAMKSIYELKLTSYQDQIKKLQGEITALKQEAEQANRKAQTLAIKIIESKTEGIGEEKEEKKNFPSMI